jgi:hypothetical protein
LAPLDAGRAVMKGPASQRLAVRAIAVAALLALAGTVSDCAPTSPTPAVSPWMDPAWLASEAARKKKSDELLETWSQCNVNAVRALAYKNIPAIAVVGDAFTLCQDAREAWVNSVVSSGISRDEAEQVATGSQNNLISMLREGLSRCMPGRSHFRTGLGVGQGRVRPSRLA